MKAPSQEIYICVVIFLITECFLYIFIDRPVALLFSIAEINHPTLVDFFRRITDLGKSVWYLWPTGLATLFCVFLARGKDVRPPLRRLFAYIGIRALFLFATISLSGVAADILKFLIGRARPILWLHNEIYGFAPFTFDSRWNSLPSGHTTTVCTLAFSLSVFYPRLRYLWFSYALVLGISRVVVDAHYMSDVLAGAVLGWLSVTYFHKYGISRIWKIIFPTEAILPIDET